LASKFVTFYTTVLPLEMLIVQKPDDSSWFCPCLTFILFPKQMVIITGTFILQNNAVVNFSHLAVPDC